jgi:spore coat polysaccharide biosynthesis protein SpsF
MKKLAIVQARMSSSRLPGKVMLDISGQPLLQHMLARVQKSRAIDGVVLATTTDPSDDILEQFCQSRDLPCYRGNLHDVLDRYYQAAGQFHADVIIRLTADCPLIDPDLIDLTVLTFLGKRPFPNPPYHSQISDHDPRKAPPFDFAANRLPPPWKRTLPIGLDVEICTFSALERAWKEARDRYQREHVMPYLYEDISLHEGLSFPEGKPSQGARWLVDHGTTPRGFRITLLNHNPDYGSLRWTVDTLADLEFVRQIFSRFEGQDDFTWLDVLALIEKEPDLASINADVKHKSAFDVDQRTSPP